MSLDNIVLFNLLFAGGLGLLLWSMPVRQTWARVAAVVLFVFVSLKYASWRVGSLPDLHFSFGSLWPWGFFLFELITLVYELWIFIVMTRLSDHSHEADSYEARLRTCSSLPTVDVFIATYNEELALLRHTILAAQNLDYPRHLVRVLVNDDGGRPELKSLTDELLGEGHYFARPDFVDAKGEKVLDGDGKPAKEGGAGKGGNDRHAFKNSGGDYILLLDADFRLKPEFLYRTLGFLLWRADIGLVQTPQRFYNGDIIGHNLLAVDCVPEDQHCFMAITEPCRDAWGNAFCTGTACLVPRRLLRLLDPEWGFPNHTICEDIELSYALLGAGYRTLYLNELLAYGLAPGSIRGFLTQRVRWCSGTIQNLFAPTGPIRGHLRVLDRIFYCEGIFYWLGFVFTALFVFAPVIFWFSGVPAVLGTPEAVCEVLFPRLIAREMIMYWLSEGTIPPVIVNVSRTLPAFHVTGAIARSLFCRLPLPALVRPRPAGFEVTGKPPTAAARLVGPKMPDPERLVPPVPLIRDRVAVHRPLFWAFASIAGATIVGMLLTVTGRSVLSPVSDLTHLNVAWSAFSVLICLLCSFACVERPYLNDGRNREVTRSRPLRIAWALVRRSVGGIS
jgi:cellulose synthase (UDP-forming)